MTSGSSTGNHTQLPAALEAGLDVYREHPFQSLQPRHWSEGLVGLYIVGFAFGYESLAVPANWSEHAMEAGEVESWARNQGCQAGDEVERIEHDVLGAVSNRLLEFVDDLPAFVGRETLIAGRVI